MTTRAKHRFGALDALRGIAALAVLAYHFRWFYSPEYCFPGGYLAVDLFFLLSGFVIGHAYDEKIQGGMTSAIFIERRLIRFLPLLWLGIAIGTTALVYQLTHGSTDFTKRDIVLSAFHNLLLLPSNFGKSNLLFQQTGQSGRYLWS